MLFEERFIFFPSKFPAGDWNLPANAEDVHFTSSDGTRLHAWYLPHESPRATLLFLHGNAGNLTHRRSVVLTLRDHFGVSAMIVDYRGYGRSEGAPRGPGVLQDARAARQWLAQREGIAEDQIVLMGRSIGAGVAVDLARDGARALILESTFASLADTAAVHFPWIPVRRLMRTKLDSKQSITAYRGPLLQSHGDLDEIVPYQHGRELFEAAVCEPKEWIRIPGGTHNDPQPDFYYQALDRFLDALP